MGLGAECGWRNTEPNPRDRAFGILRTDIEDIVPFIRHLVSDGWWITGQTILTHQNFLNKPSKATPQKAAPA